MEAFERIITMNNSNRISNADQSALIPFDRAQIERLSTPLEAANYVKKALLASEIYKALDDRESSQDAKRIYILSAHRAGELLLPETITREIGGDRKSTGYRSTVDLTAYQEALDGAGITESQAKIWQKLAKIALETIEQYFDDPKYQWTEYTIKGLFMFALGQENGGNPMTLEGAMKKFQDIVSYIALEYPDAVDDMRTLFDEILE